MNFEKKYEIIINNIESYGNNSFDIKKLLIDCNKHVESTDYVIDINDILYALVDLYENHAIDRHINDEGNVSFTNTIINDSDYSHVRK